MSEYNPSMSTKTEGVKKNIIESLDTLESKAEKRGYLKAKEEVQELTSKKEYQRGLETAWVVANELLNMTQGDYVDLFGEEKGVKYFLSLDFGGMSVNEAVDAIVNGYKPYEPHEEIRAGDEVRDPNGLLAVVTNCDTHYHLMYEVNGKTWKCPKNVKLTKTGKHYESIDFSFVF